MKNPVSIFWFRRDLRLGDNAGLFHALKNGFPVLPVFIFDTNILDKLEDKADRRVAFIHLALEDLQKQLQDIGSTLLVKYGDPEQIWHELIQEFEIKAVFSNRDYEPYGMQRDKLIAEMLQQQGIEFHSFKDIVIFERDEVLKDNGKPYTVYTPYSRRWKANLKPENLQSFDNGKFFSNFFKTSPLQLPLLESMGFANFSAEEIPSSTVSDALIENYGETRDIPGIQGTSRLGVHLRFGTISIRELTSTASALSEKFLNELIWRDFYQMILFHFPHVTERAFKPEYDRIEWNNDEEHFICWQQGKTGYPIVDAGMRELNATGYMHNRVRMITASFLTKHLLIDWRWGEAYFVKKLLDFELASNNGGWQWAASTGCDAAPYFRIFNPSLQTQKFDPKLTYIKHWVPEWNTPEYPIPLVNHEKARERALKVYKAGLSKNR